MLSVQSGSVKLGQTWCAGSPSSGPKIAVSPASTTSSPRFRPPQPFASAQLSQPDVFVGWSSCTINMSGRSTDASVLPITGSRPKPVGIAWTVAENAATSPAGPIAP